MTSALTHFSLLLALVSACGAPQEAPPATHSHFDAIQRQEAVLEGARNGALEGDTCGLRCRSTSRGCAATTRICDIAASVTDADANARCENAKERCRAYETALADCEC